MVLGGAQGHLATPPPLHTLTISMHRAPVVSPIETYRFVTVQRLAAYECNFKYLSDNLLVDSIIVSLLGLTNITGGGFPPPKKKLVYIIILYK